MAFQSRRADDRGKRLFRPFGAVGLLLAMVVGLGGCSSTLTEGPTGSIPVGTQEQTAAPLGYPAVHDMPPARSDVVLTKDELKKAQAEMNAARDAQAKRVSDADKAQ